MEHDRSPHFQTMHPPFRESPVMTRTSTESNPIPAASIDKIKAFAKECLSHARGSHGWEHTERVHRLCIHIGQIEKADLEVLEVAAYLHDVGRFHQDESKGRICHGEKGAEMAAAFLEHYPLPEKKKENIIHCIRSHRFRGSQEPQTLEAKILFDADKLDAIGAIGVARTFLFAGEVGATLHNPKINVAHTAPYTKEDTGYREYMVKLSKIKDRMLTREGRRMAKARHAFMARFFDRFLEEYEGKK
jgi:uncharacterized protein